MPDRLSELRRQRALLEQHLAWLDREIELAAVPETAGHATAIPVGTSATSAPALPADHAAAVDRGTGAAATITNASGARQPPEAGPAMPAPPANPPAGGAVSAESLLDQYRVSPEALKTDVRKGCFLYFGLAFALLFAVIAILWMTLRS